MNIKVHVIFTKYEDETRTDFFMNMNIKVKLNFFSYNKFSA